MSQNILRVVRMAGASAVVGIIMTAGIAYAVVPTLSQTSITVGIGQSLSVTSGNNIGVYMENNSNATVASVSVNGTQVAVTGTGLGSAVLQICAVGTASDCTNLNVTVQAGSVSGISFSQSTLSFSTGSTQSVTVSGGNGSYTISSNSNTSVASTNLSGNALAVSGVAAGSATITVCDTTNLCGTLPVTISTSLTSNLVFGQNNLSLTAGGSQIVTISGGNGSYNITNNTNSSAVSVGMSSSGVTVYANATGNASITVCDTSNLCGTLIVNVTASTVNQVVVFSVASPTIVAGQNLNVTLSGNASSFFVLSNANPNVVQATIANGMTLSLVGGSAGTDSLTICATGGAGCNALPVTVTSPASTAPATTTQTTTVPVTTTVAQPTTITAGTVVANTALLAEIQTLQTAVTQVLAQIQSIQTQLNQIESQVNAGSGASVSNASNGLSATSYNFTELLNVGSSDAQVTALQQRLSTLGFYSGPITGFYGTLTGQAVSKYQTSHGIAATGYVGPATRTALNAGN